VRSLVVLLPEHGTDSRRWVRSAHPFCDAGCRTATRACTAGAFRTGSLRVRALAARLQNARFQHHAGRWMPPYLWRFAQHTSARQTHSNFRRHRPADTRTRLGRRVCAYFCPQH
jgi:hypothetical protein